MPTDYTALRLKANGDKRLLDDILQMECRDRFATKFPLAVASQSFRFPSRRIAEMATSEAIARIHASLSPAEGARVLDMTAGLGIDTFAFATAGASVTSIELDEDTFNALSHNAAAIAPGKVFPILGDSVVWLENHPEESFDTIFIDPARRDDSGRHVSFSRCAPDVVSILPLLRSRGRHIIIKASPLIDITQGIKELGGRADIVTVGTTKECKECLFLLSPQTEGTLRCITAGKGEFRFTDADERTAEATYVSAVDGGYLYEPYPAVMKGAPFKLLSARCGVAKLHPNTHLYYSVTPSDRFPGERFEILEALPFSNKTCKEIAARHPMINVATRNFHLSAPELAKKCKVKEGGENRLMGCTLADGSRMLLVLGKATAL